MIIHQVNEFIPIMQELVKLHEFHTYVELGLGDGVTFNHMVELDIIKLAVGVEDNPQYNIAEYKEVELHNMTTDEFAKIWKDPIDLLFIDADHEYHQVLKDFDNLSPYVTERGLILLHDTYPAKKKLTGRRACHDAWKAADTIHRTVNYINWEIVTIPGQKAGLSIIRNAKTHHLHWMR